MTVVIFTYNKCYFIHSQQEVTVQGQLVILPIMISNIVILDRIMIINILWAFEEKSDHHVTVKL